MRSTTISFLETGYSKFLYSKQDSWVCSKCLSSVYCIKIESIAGGVSRSMYVFGNDSMVSTESRALHPEMIKSYGYRSTDIA